MSRYFDLMNSQGGDSAVQPPSASGEVSRSKPNLPTGFHRRVVEAGPGFSMTGFLRLIQERRWTIATFAIVVVVIVMAVSLLMKPEYEAVGRVVFHRDSDSGVLGFKGVDTSLLEDPEDRAAIDTQIGILETDALAMEVIKDLRLDEDPRFSGRLMPPGSEDSLVSLFHKNLKISKVKGTRLIEIDFRSTDAQLAADIVNHLLNDYRNQFYRNQYKASAQISDFLSGQLKDLQAKVSESQQKLVDYQKANGIFGMDDKQNIVIAKLDDLNTMLTAAEADRVQKEVNYRLARSGRPELIAKLDPDNLITKLRGQQADLESQIAQASVQLGPANPKMKELSNQLAQVQQSLRAEVRRIGERIDYEYQSAVAREGLLRSSLEAQKQAANTLNANVIQANILKHDFETNRQLYEDLLQKQKEVGITSNLRSTNLWIVDPARPPKLPAEPKILRNFGLAVLFGISGGVLLAFGLSKMHEKIDTLEQAIMASSCPSLGVVPLLGVKGKSGAVRQFPGVNRNVKPELVSSLQPLSVAAECYRAMLTSILLSHSTPPAVILVTSALSGEGKTAVSTNLAIALARSQKRVLLVDTDLRRPSVHRALRLTASAGLGALLKKTATFEEVVIGSAEIPNLFVLPVGRVNLPDDTELLVSGFSDLLARWREEYDHVVIDTPPVLPVTDAVRMSVQADSVILVIRAGQVRKAEFLRAQDLLLKVNAHLSGFVLNGADLGSSDFAYYYGYEGSETRHLGAGA